MRNAWLIKNCRYAFHRVAPTNSDIPDVAPFIWVDVATDIAYIHTAGMTGTTKWVQKTPDRTIITSSNSIFVLETTDDIIILDDYDSSSVTIRLAIKDGEAMFFDDSIDFSDYAGELSNAPYLVTFTDHIGKTATAYCAEIGDGEALESNLLVGLDLNTWTEYSATVTDADSFTLTATNGAVAKSLLSIGSLWKGSLAMVVSAGTGSLTGGAQTPTYAANNNSGYGTAITDHGQFTVMGGGVGATADVVSASLQKVTDVPVTGLRLVAAKESGVRNMASIESGFNPNTIVSINITSMHDD